MEKKRWDRRSSLGVQNYTDVKHLSSFQDLVNLKTNYTFIGLEQTPQATSLTRFVWPDSPVLLLVGEENCGLSSEILDLCDFCVVIPQFGSVRSLNLGSAASIALYDYVSKRTYLNKSKSRE